MKILVPIELTEYTTNLSENDYPAYISGSYALEYRCTVLSEHNIYESLKNSNTAEPTGKTDENWALVGKTNVYKAIDDKVSTQTINNGNITFEFPTLKSTSLAFLNTQCTSITVEVLNGTDVIYTETKSGRTRKTTGWFSYFFGDFEYKKFFLFEHLYNPNGTYRVTVTGTECKVGVMLRGRILDLGNTKWEPSISPTDYSKYDIDQWGETYLKEGNFRLVARGEMGIDTIKLATILDIFISRRGTLSLYILADTYSIPFIYGYVREPQLIWQNPVKSFYTLDIQGVA